MQQVQDMLEFTIDTPSDLELREYFGEGVFIAPDEVKVVAKKHKVLKKRNRKSNKQKRLERIDRDS